MDQQIQTTIAHEELAPIERNSLFNEWHARPTVGLQPPFRCSYVLSLLNGRSNGDAWQSIHDFCEETGQPTPSRESRFHVLNANNCKLKWESHTEATGHTILVPGNAQPPFGETALDFLDRDKRVEIMSDIFVGVHVEVLSAPGGEDVNGYSMARSLLGAESLYGGDMSGGDATVWSSFKSDANGFIRIIVFDRGMTARQAGRLVQRLLDMEGYRMLAIRALPAARQVMSAALTLEPQLSAVMRRLKTAGTLTAREQALYRITELSTRVEELSAEHASAFSGARAYARVVERRTEEVREEIVAGHQRYTNFLMRALAPAMATCDAAERRVNELSERVARSASLLNAMVDFEQSRQNQAVLASLADSAQRQLRLQQAVEGFSIFAISYYAVGVLKYIFDAFDHLPLNIDSTFLTGVSAPVVFGLVYLSVRIMRRKIRRLTANTD